MDDPRQRLSGRSDPAQESSFADRISELRELERLVIEAAHILLTVSEPEQLVATLFKQLSDRLELDAYFNYLMALEEDHMVLAGSAGAPPEAQEQLLTLQFGQAVCGTVAERGEAMVLANLQERDDEMTELIRSFGLRTYACFPLTIDGTLLGTLSFGSRRRDRFDRDEVDALRAIASLAAVAFRRHQNEVDREQLLERESNARREAEEANRLRDEFLAIVSHELSSPMTTSLGWAELLQCMDDLTPEQKEAADQIARNVRRQQRLLQDLIDISKMKAGKLSVVRVRTELGKIVRRTIDSFVPFAAEKEIALRFETMDGEGPTVSIDPQRIEQVVANLVGNALKFTPEGGDVAVDLFFDDREAHITVRDTGPGIPPDRQAKIFEPFVQAGATKRSGGMGLGLAIARNLIEQHGGRLTLESGGEGSTFKVILPRDE